MIYHVKLPYRLVSGAMICVTPKTLTVSAPPGYKVEEYAASC